MARLPRLTLPGQPHHVIQRGNNRQPVFVDRQDREMLLALLGEVAMADGVGADRNQRIVGKRFQFVPGHAEVAADRRLVDTMAGA